MSDNYGSLQRLYDIVEFLVDERVGILRYAGEMPREAGAPDFFHFYAKACNTKAFTTQTNFSDSGGASANRGRAMAKAIGEAVERYCAAIYERKHLPLTSYHSAPFRCVPPDDFSLYSKTQYAEPHFPYQPFAHDSLIRWTPAWNLASLETWHVPASMVFIPYECDSRSEEVSIVQPISTGLACHCSQQEAAVSAICEVIERDAFTIVWQAKLAMPRIRLGSLNRENQDLVARFERTGNSATIFNITLDHGVPTILSVLQCTALESPALIFAASSHLDPKEAVRKSLEELAHTRRHAQHLKNSLPPIVPEVNFENIWKQDRHLRLYSQHENVRLADFIFSSDRTIDLDSIASLDSGNSDRNLQFLAEKIHDVNHDVLLADLTTPDVRQLGLSVVRALIPGFHPLFMGYRLRALGGRRLYEVPQQLGYAGISSENYATDPFRL